MTINEANLLRDEIGRLMIKSINHPDRYPIGAVKFTETQFFANTIARAITSLENEKHMDNLYINEINGLNSTICIIRLFQSRKILHDVNYFACLRMSGKRSFWIIFRRNYSPTTCVAGTGRTNT